MRRYFIVCKTDAACVGFPLPGGVRSGIDDESVTNMTCYKGGETVFSNHQICDITSTFFTAYIHPSSTHGTTLQTVRFSTCSRIDHHKLPSAVTTQPRRVHSSFGQLSRNHSTVPLTRAPRRRKQDMRSIPPRMRVSGSSVNVYLADSCAEKMGA